MKQYITFLSLMITLGAAAQNVGIGTVTPTNAKLVIVGSNGNAQAIFGEGQAGVSLENNDPLVGFNNYYLSGRKFMSNGYAGGISMASGTGNFLVRSYGTGSTGAAVTTSTTLLTVLQAGNVGIGNASPTLAGLVVDAKVGAINAMFGSNTSGVAIESNYPGIGFNSYYNGGRKSINTGFGSLVGQDPLTGRFYISTSSASVTGQGTTIPLYDRLVINPDGSLGVEGNTDPTAPLSFANTVGNKISLYGDATAPHYGLGIQGALMQLYTNGSNADIALGYGRSGSFTEKYRFGNSGYMNIQNGRIRFTGQLSAGNSQGIEFTNFAGTTLKGFFGQFDDNNMGFFGYPGAGWAMLFNQTTGQLNLGATRNANDVSYKLNVGGKILAEEVRVNLQANWPDYVFAKNYKLPSLSDVEKYIDKNNHLPNVPAASEIEKSGIALGQMQSKMMEKIEELTLYIIDLKKEVEVLKTKTTKQ
ncbi:MAG: hypothetical protein ABIX01_14380 [Chitinophagaceae bacterium]